MDKSPDAFRTISEVAETLETPAHVLRFWESRFPQIRPVKRAGGRRYYRPADVALLIGIKHLLHDEGMTIRGVQKILREQGVRHVAALSGQDYSETPDLDEEAALEAALTLNFGPLDSEDIAPEQAATATVVALQTALRRQDPGAVPAPQNAPQDLFADIALPRQPRDSAPKSVQAAGSLADRLRTLPPHAFAGSDLAAHLHLRLQALYQRMLSGADHAATTR